MKIKSIGVLAILLSFATGLSYAYECADKVNEMNVQILKDGYITSLVDGQQFTMVVNPLERGHGLCAAQGYFSNKFICNIKWENSNWRNTLHCG